MVQFFIQRYRDDIPALSNLYAQLDMWKVKWRTFTGVLPTTLQDLLKHTDKLLFPSIHEAIRILATIPVTTCTCERSISGLRRVKTWMRNTMTEERLNNLCVIMFNRVLFWIAPDRAQCNAPLGRCKFNYSKQKFIKNFFI